MGPIDYTTAVASPFASAMQGFVAGAGIQQVQQQQAQQQAQAQAINGLMTNPNAGADDYAKAMVLVPGLHEQLKNAWAVKNTDQQQAHLSELTQQAAAIDNNRPDIATGMMRKRADAMPAGKEADALRAQADVIDAHPELGRFMIRSQIFGHPDGKKAIDALAAMGGEDRAAAQAPADLEKKVADAKTATVTAKFAEPVALKDLEVKGWNVENIKSEIGYRKEANRIAAMNAAVAAEGNALKRQELSLQVQTAQQALDQKIRDRGADLESASGNIDNMLNTIERVKKNKELPNVLGTIEGRMPVLLNDDAADAVALIDTLKSQTFLAMVPQMKAMGSLSNAEGEKLQTALQSLDRVQSEKQFRASLDEAARLVTKVRATVAKRYGGPASPIDTPAAPGARPPLSSFGG